MAAIVILECSRFFCYLKFLAFPLFKKEYITYIIDFDSLCFQEGEESVPSWELRVEGRLLEDVSTHNMFSVNCIVLCLSFYSKSGLSFLFLLQFFYMSFIQKPWSGSFHKA